MCDWHVLMLLMVVRESGTISACVQTDGDSVRAHIDGILSAAEASSHGGCRCPFLTLLTFVLSVSPVINVSAGRAQRRQDHIP